MYLFLINFKYMRYIELHLDRIDSELYKHVDNIVP